VSDHPLGVVVVGAGAIGRVHARVACDDPNLQVVGIVASSPDRAERLADDVAATGAPRPVVGRTLSSILSEAGEPGERRITDRAAS
jgi:predicted dehydrogenase